MAANPNEPSSQSTNSDDGESTTNDNTYHSFEGVQFVRQALDVAQSDRGLSPDGIANANGLCRVVLELAVDQFGAYGKDILIDWRISKSEDIGTIVYRLIEAGLIRESPTDSITDFNDLFDLNSAPESWKLKW